MIRRLVFPAWLAVPLLGLAVGCTTPADRLSEAMHLADQGQFDEALTMLEEVQRTWPARPEASAARNAVEGIRERAALARYDAGEYGAVVRALEALPGPAKAKLYEQKPGMRWVPRVYGPDADEGTLIDLLGAAEAPESLKQHATQLLCQKASVHAPVCRGEGVELNRVDLAASIAALERVESACRVLEGMRGRCQGEAGTAVFTALDAKFGEKLRTRIAELERSAGTRLAGD